MPAKKEPSYSKALEEIEDIVTAIEDESIDVDVLATKVKRASELIKFCRGKLRSTEQEIKQVLAEIEGEGTSPEPVAPSEGVK